MKTKCVNCGFSNLETSEYCQNCGQFLNTNSQDNIRVEAKPIHEQIEDIDDVIFKPKKKKWGVLKVFVVLFSILGVMFFSLIVWYMIFPDEETTSVDSTTSTKDIVSEGQWQLFNSTEHGFNVKFPADPEMTRIPEETLENGVTYSGVQYLSSKNDDEIYAVQVGDYDVAPSDFDNKLGLEGALNGILNAIDATLTNSTFTKFMGYDSIDYTFKTKENYYGKGNAFIKDDASEIKMYLFMVLNTSNNFDDFYFFKNSFSLR